MTVFDLDGMRPVFTDAARTYVAPGAMLVGRVRLGVEVSIWFHAVLRGDNDTITIGDGSNIQDGAVLHVDAGFPLAIGDGCTIGHRAIVHGATIGDHSLVGMGATILNGAVIGRNCLVGANALVTEGKVFPDGSLIIGAPARLARALSEAEIAGLRQSAASYVGNGRRYAVALQPAAAAPRSDPAQQD